MSDLRTGRCAGAAKVVKVDIEPVVDFLVQAVELVAQGLGSDALCVVRIS